MMSGVRRLCRVLCSLAVSLCLYVYVRRLDILVAVRNVPGVCTAENFTAQSNQTSRPWRPMKIGKHVYYFPPDIYYRPTPKRFLIKVPKVVPDEIAAKVYKQLVMETSLECRYHARVGDVRDGGWDVCLAEPYGLKEGCLVYDFGIADRWSFDDMMVEEFGCVVRAFDPTMDLEEHDRSPDVHFYPVGLGGANTDTVISGKNCTVRTLGTLMDRFGEGNRTIDYLKIDIENSEWPALEAMFEEGRLQTQVKQIGIELHAHRFSTPERYQTRISTLRTLHKLGFRKWKEVWNPRTMYFNEDVRFNAAMHEVYYLNMRMLLAKTSAGAS